jgi:hypothetical protein
MNKILEVGRKDCILDTIDSINEILMDSGIKMQFVLEDKNNSEDYDCLYFSFIPQDKLVRS